MRCAPHAKESVRIGEITSRSVGGASPCHFFKHESRESYECRYVKRLWRLESHEICRRPTDQREVMSTEERLWFPLSSHYLPSISGASHVITSPSVSGASHVIREISNTSGVSSQWSFDRFARFVFFKITASVCFCQWASPILVFFDKTTPHGPYPHSHIPPLTFHIKKSCHSTPNNPIC